MVLQIGRYQTERELGRGGMGIVYAARDPEGRAVAVKLLKPGTASRERRFQREVEALVRLRHEGLVRLLDAGDHHGWPFLVTELVEGESLEERLARDGPLEPPLAAALLRDVARGLAHAHAQGVLHRDVKPSNVLIDRDGRGRLIDFGLTRDAAGPGSLTHSGQLLGTPGFWSPEQARGDRAAVGPATDVYGAGATLYAALTREPPATGDTLHELLVATTERAPTPPSSLRPGVDRALEALCLRALAKDPAARFPSADALGDALDAWLARGKGGGGRGRTAALLAGAAGALALAGAAAAWTSAGRRPEVTDAPAAPAPAPAPAPGPVAAPEPTPTERAAALVAGGRERLGARDWSGARAAFDEALAVDPRHAPALVGRARARIGLGDVDGALDDADAAVDLAPEDADAWYVRGDARARRGDDEATEERALADFRRALGLDPGHPEALEARGWFRFNTRDQLEGALEDFTRALERGPRPTALARRGMARMHQGDRAGGLADFAASLALEPSALVHHERARIYFEEGELTLALADLDRAFALEPHWSHQHLRGLVKRDLGDLAGAEADLVQAAEAQDGSPLAWTQVGDVRQQRGDLPGAEAAYTRAIEGEPRRPAAWVARGSVRAVRRDARGARADFDQAIAVAPREALGWLARGDLQHAEGDVDGALEDWGRAADLDPRDPWAPFNRGSALHNRGDHEAAAVEFGRAIDREPRMGLALAGRGAARAALGDRRGARDDLRRALPLLPPESREWRESQALLQAVSQE